jgi:hypothetical protein
MGCCESTPTDVDPPRIIVNEAAATPRQSQIVQDNELPFCVRVTPRSKSETDATSEQNSDFFMRQMAHFTLMQNLAHNALQFEGTEFWRKPDPSAMEHLESDQIQQVVSALRDALAEGGKLSLGCTKSGTVMQFIAAQFKHFAMVDSMLHPTVIEAALTKIIDRRQDYPELTDQRIIYYHDRGQLLNDRGVRIFVVGGTTPE